MNIILPYHIQWVMYCCVTLVVVICSPCARGTCCTWTVELGGGVCVCVCVFKKTTPDFPFLYTYSCAHRILPSVYRKILFYFLLLLVFNPLPIHQYSKERILRERRIYATFLELATEEHGDATSSWDQCPTPQKWWHSASAFVSNKTLKDTQVTHHLRLSLSH